MNLLRSVDLLLSLQSISSPLLDRVMQGISFLGDGLFYLALLVFLYWRVSRKLAIRLATATLLSLYVNFLLKDFFAIPRPAGTGLRILEETIDFSFPSGHAQSVTSCFFFLAFYLRKTSLFILAGVLVFLVSFSRLYLGVHYLGDVLGGIALGFAFALGFWVFFKNCSLKFPSPLFGLLLIIPVSYALFFFASSHLGFVVAGALSGALVGYLLSLWIGLEEKTLRTTTYLLGIGGLIALYLGGKSVDLPSNLWLFFRYFLLTIFATFIFPLLASFREKQISKRMGVT
ncbi:MAG: hypothetical protein PWP04_1210 [Candidatus Atribacteria bacterium]|nr:hypothetical protein [Candidatus Atribacteria bacterium]